MKLSFAAPCRHCAPDASPPPASIVVLDLDTTLRGPRGPVGIKTVNALASLHPRGVTLVLATRHPRATALHCARMLGADYVMPLDGGALIEAGGETIWTSPGLAPDLTERLERAADRYGLALHLHTPVAWWSRGGTERALRQYAEHFALTADERAPTPPVLRAELIGDPTALDTIYSVLPSSVAAVRRAGPFGPCLDVSPDDVSYANALVSGLVLLDSDWDAVLTIGNWRRSESLFRLPGTSVSMLDSDAVLDRAATHRVRLRPDQGAVHTVVAAHFDGDEEAKQHLSCLHRARV